jgi:hypothetical protein
MAAGPAQDRTALGVVPGDWFVVAPEGDLFAWIMRAERWSEWLTYRRRAKGQGWGHAGVASRLAGGTLMIVQAEPGGAVEVPWAWGHRPHMWSTGTGLSVPEMGKAALLLKGRGYGFEDYAAIGAHAAHIPVPHLRAFIESSQHLICSQLVDVAAQLCDVHLFDDGRWNGFVTPLALAFLLLDLGVPVGGLR